MSIREAIRHEAAYRFRPHPARVKLDQNEAPDDLPEALRREALDRLASLEYHRYPELHADRLATAIARGQGWSEDGVVVTGGSNVLIQSLVIAAGIDQTVLTVRPTFSVYAIQARLLGAALHELPLSDGFELPVDGLLGAMRGRCGVLFVANPAAPTGNLHPRSDIETLLAGSDGWTVVVDEAYHEFAGSDHRDLLERHRNLVLLRTFSKAMGLAGARLGYLLAAPDLAREIRKVVLPFSVSALQTAVGEVVLAAPERVAERVAAIVAERRRVAAALTATEGVEVFPSETNFLLLRVAEPERIHRALLDQGVLVRRQDHLPGLAGCLRVSVGRPDENDAFLTAFERVGPAVGRG